MKFLVDVFDRFTKFFSSNHTQFELKDRCISKVTWNLIPTKLFYRSGTVNSKSFVGKVLLLIKWKFELN